jgi:hypothetical protein
MTDFVPPRTARELIEFAAPMAAGLFEMDGGLLPIWHAVRRNGEHGVVASPFGDGASKDLVATAMREVFERLDVVAYVFVCESWMLTCKEDDVDKIKRKGIRDDTRRVECLWYAAEDAAGEITAYQLIERPDGPEGPGKLRPLVWLDKCDRKEGRFVGMLPVKGFTKH